MTFSWDPGKAAANFKKHGVDFREAATALADPLSTTFPDDAHSITERRFVTIGVSAREEVLVVVHTETTKGDSDHQCSIGHSTRARIL